MSRPVHLQTVAVVAAFSLVVTACSGAFSQEDVDGLVADAVETAVADAVAAAEDEAVERTAELEAELAGLEEALSAVTGELETVTAERDRLGAELADLASAEGDDSGAATGDPAAVVGGDLVVVSDGLTLPTAAAGTVEVVSFQALGERRVAVTVHNNTGGQVSGLEATVTVRDGAGTLVSSTATDDFFPQVLENGQAAVGGFFFIDGDTPAGGSAEFTVDWSEGDVHSEGFFARYRLPIVEWVTSGSQIAGRVGNPLDTTVELVSIGAGCFDADGSMLWFADSFADRDEIPAGSDSPFTIRTPGACDLLIIAASGWEA